MFKTESLQRRESREKFRDGKGVSLLCNIVEKEELLGNCRFFGKITLDPGCSIGYHQHDREEEVYYILSGQGVVNDNGDTRTVNPGDSVLTGNGAFHSIENQGDVPLEFIGVILTYDPPER